MPFTSTVFGVPPLSTNFGPPSNADKISKFGTGFGTSSSIPGAIGVTSDIDLFVPSVANSQTDLVVAAFKADGRMRVISLESFATAVTATATFHLYNSTQAVDVVGTVTPSTTPAYTTTIANPVIEKDDIIQVLANTNGSGAITNLSVKIARQYFASPASA